MDLLALGADHGLGPPVGIDEGAAGVILGQGLTDLDLGRLGALFFVTPGLVLELDLEVKRRIASRVLGPSMPSAAPGR
jgi:hypothetical protein